MRKARCFISREKQVFLVGFSLAFPRFPRISKIRLNTSLDLYWKGYCLLLLFVGEQSCLKLAFQNCWPSQGFRRKDEGLKAPDFNFSVFFFFSALVSACLFFLQSSESFSIGSFFYFAKTAQTPSIESVILINLFLFFSFEMAAFKMPTSEMLSMMILL